LEGAALTEDLAIVSLEKMTRFYLQNHGLAERASKTDIIGVVGKICGLHAQLPMTPHHSLWNRIEEFKAEMLDQLMYRDKSLVKTWFMRGTLHIIPTLELPVYHNSLRRMWFEHQGKYMNDPRWPPAEEREKELYPMIKEVLAEKPLLRKELSERVRLLLANRIRPYEELFSAWGGILKETSYLGLTVHAEPSGREACFARLDKWLPSIDLNEVDEQTAKQQLLKKYLHGYGPASAQDFACWSGMLTSEAKEIIGETDGLKKFRVEGARAELSMLEEDFPALERADLGAEVPPRLLPKYDPYLMGHKNRSRIIREDMLQKVYRPIVGEVAATVLVNGRIVGTWTSKRSRRALRIFVRPLEKITEETLSSLKPVANEFAQFVGAEEAQIVSEPS